MTAPKHGYCPRCKSGCIVERIEKLYCRNCKHSWEYQIPVNRRGSGVIAPPAYYRGFRWPGRVV